MLRKIVFGEIQREHGNGFQVSKVLSFGKEIIYVSQNWLKKWFNENITSRQKKKKRN